MKKFDLTSHIYKIYTIYHKIYVENFLNRLVLLLKKKFNLFHMIVSYTEHQKFRISLYIT